jgi:hypothetical protein
LHCGVIEAGVEEVFTREKLARESHNQDPKPFVWIKTPEQILANAVLYNDTSVTRH